MKVIKLPINYTEKYIIPFKAKKNCVCLRSPDPPYFSAADPNLFYRQLFDSNSVGNHFFQTLAKMASELKQVLAKMK